MVIKLYHCPPSPPARAAAIVSKVLGIDVEIKNIDLFAKEHLKPEYLKINPQHTVPTLVDGNFTVIDSHAIATYLASQYGKNDSFYPKDPKQRSLVDQRLYFDCGILFPRMRAIFFPILFLGETKIPADKKKDLDEALACLNTYIQGHNFVAGNNLTVADCCLIASLASIAAVGWNLEPYSNIKAWMGRCASVIPDFEKINQEGAEQLGVAIKSKMAPGQL